MEAEKAEKAEKAEEVTGIGVRGKGGRRGGRGEKKRGGGKRGGGRRGGGRGGRKGRGGGAEIELIGRIAKWPEYSRHLSCSNWCQSELRPSSIICKGRRWRAGGEGGEGGPAIRAADEGGRPRLNLDTGQCETTADSQRPTFRAGNFPSPCNKSLFSLTSSSSSSSFSSSYPSPLTFSPPPSIATIAATITTTTINITAIA